MLKRPQILQNTDKFYGLADSALSSIFRFLCGIALARLGGAEVFATYILLITTNVIFLQIPSTCYLTPLLNRGTGAASVQSGALHQWAQRGVERAALVFLFIVLVAYTLIPQIEMPLSTLCAFSLATVAQLFQLSRRTRLQMSFRQSRALGANIVGCGTHLSLSTFLWLQNVDLQTAFWWGALAGACLSSLMMCSTNRISDKVEEAQTIIQRAKSDGRAMLTGSLANSACSRAQPYVLAGITSTQTLAYYGVIWSLIGPIRLLSMALTNLLRPRLALHHNNGDSGAFKRSARIAFTILITGGLTATLISSFIGPWAIGLLFGNELMSAGQWLSWGYALRNFGCVDHLPNDCAPNQKREWLKIKRKTTDSLRHNFPAASHTSHHDLGTQRHFPQPNIGRDVLRTRSIPPSLKAQYPHERSIQQKKNGSPKWRAVCVKCCNFAGHMTYVVADGYP